MTFCNTGATLQSWENSILGFENHTNYLNRQNPYFGATIGPVANRLYQPNGILLHGGKEGWSWKKWNKSSPAAAENSNVTKFELRDTHITAHVTYTLTKSPDKKTSQLEIEYSVNSNELGKSMPISMTNHSYFCLDKDGAEGEGHVTVDDHELWLCNDHVIEHKDGLQSEPPTGELVRCEALLKAGAGESRDTFSSLGRFSDLSSLGGTSISLNGTVLDHTFAVDNDRLSRDAKLDTRDDPLVSVAILSRGKTRLTVKTTEPCFQVYTGDYNNVELLPGESRDFGRRSGVAIECSRPTNAWNVPGWRPWVDLGQGEYGAKIIYVLEREWGLGIEETMRELGRNFESFKSNFRER